MPQTVKLKLDYPADLWEEILDAFAANAVGVITIDDEAEGATTRQEHFLNCLDRWIKEQLAASDRNGVTASIVQAAEAKKQERESKFDAVVKDVTKPTE